MPCSPCPADARVVGVSSGAAPSALPFPRPGALAGMRSVNMPNILQPDVQAGDAVGWWCGGALPPPVPPPAGISALDAHHEAGALCRMLRAAAGPRVEISRWPARSAAAGAQCTAAAWSAAEPAFPPASSFPACGSAPPHKRRLWTSSICFMPSLGPPVDSRARAPSSRTAAAAAPRAGPPPSPRAAAPFSRSARRAHCAPLPAPPPPPPRRAPLRPARRKFWFKLAPRRSPPWHRLARGQGRRQRRASYACRTGRTPTGSARPRSCAPPLGARPSLSTIPSRWTRCAALRPTRR